MQDPIDKFKDIRSYNDDEIQPAIQRVINSEEFLDAILRFRFPHSAKFIRSLIKPFLRIFLSRKWGDIQSIDDMQMVVIKYMQRMINSTTSSITHSGLDQLDPEQKYLFVSNHRDIAMDPAFVNWVLYFEKFKTVRIATGDNLFSKPYISDLMRMNKSFIVKRSVPGIREMLKSLTHLSSYIATSLREDSNIWIAQKEGRAKDGFDKTDPAIIKMFYVNGKKEKIPFQEYIRELKIVPVSISYELDPCDEHKAQEISDKQLNGEYLKGQYEDIESIVKGILGQKGHIHIGFGEPITEHCDDPESVANEIDRQIYKNYFLHPSNLIAANSNDHDISVEDKKSFEDHIQKIKPELRDIVLKMYANPVINSKKEII